MQTSGMLWDVAKSNASAKLRWAGSFAVQTLREPEFYFCVPTSSSIGSNEHVPHKSGLQISGQYFPWTDTPQKKMGFSPTVNRLASLEYVTQMHTSRLERDTRVKSPPILPPDVSSVDEMLLNAWIRTPEQETRRVDVNNKKDILPVFARLITVYNEHHKKTKSEEMTVEYVKKGWETIFNCLHTHYPFQHDGPIANTRMYNSSLHPELLSDFQIGCVSENSLSTLRDTVLWQTPPLPPRSQRSQLE